MAPTNIHERIDTIEAARHRFDAAIRTLSDDQLVMPMLENGWSVKDTLAHLCTAKTPRVL